MANILRELITVTQVLKTILQPDSVYDFLCPCGKFHPFAHIEVVQLPAVADTRQHEELGGSYGPCREDHLLAREHLLHLRSRGWENKPILGRKDYAYT